MSLIRLIQESEVIRNGSMFSSKPYVCEVDGMKQIIKEKDVLIDNHTERIKELENRVAELETALEVQNQENQESSIKHEEEVEAKSSVEYLQMQGLLNKYEQFISKIMASYETIKEQRNVANSHLACLECSFADLIEKYERLKGIVFGYQENQNVLLQHIETYKNAMQSLQKQYDDFKDYANAMLDEANLYITKKDKKHISEMAKAKTRVLQGKAKISELKNTISIISTSAGDASTDTSNKKSPFTPLLNIIFD